MSQAIDKIVFSGIIFILVFTQLAFGGVHVWAYTVFEITVFLLFLLSICNQVVSQHRTRNGLRGNISTTVQWVVSPLNVFFVLIISLIVIQLIPLPAFIVKFLSPHTFEMKKNVYELKSVPGDSADAWMSLSLYNLATYNGLTKLLTYAALYFMIINTVRDRKRIKTLVYVLIIMGLFQVLYGVAQTYSNSQKIWWWTNDYYRGWVTGTYINRNHLAGFLEMVIPLCMGFMIANLKRRKPKVIRNWVASGEERSRIILLFSVAVLLGLGLLLTGSRAGIISFGICMFFMALLFLFKVGHRKYGIVAICLCVLILGYGLHVGIEKTVKRFEHLGNLYDRLEIAESVIPMIGDFPVLGIGWGGFTYMYPRYALSTYSGRVYLGHAHNDWVEMTAELGIAGFCLVILALVVYLAKTIKLWLRRHDTFALGIGAGVIAGVVSISIHSFFDFNMHIPANPMALCSVLAIGFLSMHIERHSTYDKFFYKTRSVPVNGKGPLILLATLVFVVSFFVFQRVTGHFMAEVNCATVQNSTLNRDNKPPLWEIKRAIDYDPANAQYHDKLARHYMRLPIKSKDLKSKINEEVIRNLEKAISLNPANGLYWYDLGLRYSYKGYSGDEYLTKWLPMADAALERAIHLRPHDAYLLHKTGHYWVWRSSTLSEAEGSRHILAQSSKLKGKSLQPQASDLKPQTPFSREQGIDKFQGLFRRSLEIDKKYWKRAVERVWNYYPDERIVMGIVPEGDRDLGGRVKRWLGLRE